MPTGTVDFVTIIFLFFATDPISLIDLYTYDRFTFKDPFLFGVPTQINIISEEFTAFFKSVVKKSRRAKKFFFINSFNPGS